MGKVLVATFYKSYSVIAAVNFFSINRLILLVNKKPDETMRKSMSLIAESIGSVLPVDFVPIETYDLVGAAADIVEIIDSVPDKDELFIDITSGQKPKALVLLFAAYARPKRIKKIVYIVEETKQIITLPKMSYSLNATQRYCLKVIGEVNSITTVNIANNMGYTKAIVYKNIRELLAMDAVEKRGEELFLTDFGKILLL